MAGGGYVAKPGELVPGEVHFAEGEICINADRECKEIIMENTGDRPIQIGSHYHLYEVNSAIKFYDAEGHLDPERLCVFGWRFDIPSSTSVRFEPNEKKPVNVIPLTGQRAVWSLSNLTDGALKDGPKVAYTKAIEGRNKRTW